MNKKNGAESISDLERLRHSAAHLLAHAVQELYPDTKFTIGPATPEGFFYDLLPTKNFKEEDLALLEARMHEISARNLPLTHEHMAKKEARALYKDNPFKLELIEGIEGDTVGVARQGDFFDLCRGGHVRSTGDIKYFKLLSISGSYWRADKKNQPLQRIAGTAFLTAQDLQQFEQQREDALKYDHRRLGKELDLFSFHHEGPGFPFFHPRGQLVINLLKENLRAILRKAGYHEIGTPTMLSDELWKRSGHYNHYKNNMYFCTIDERHYAIKPMNCPGALLIYKERPHSYRELPLRLAEFGHVHRFELSGVLHGLFRVRAFTIDDGHIICTPEQITQELRSEIATIYGVLKKYHFESIHVYLSTKPDNAMGDDALWTRATNALADALTQENIAYTVQEGEGAFYGPKIEFHIKDSMGRTWQCGTVQLDFFQPENFDLTYVNAEGKQVRPVMIHRAAYGSLERFFGILLEHTKGWLPFFLAPTQIAILTITDQQKSYAQKILDAVTNAGFRAYIDESSDPISGKIKTTQVAHIPWMFVLGKKEEEQNTVTLRSHTGEQEFGVSLEQAMKKLSALL